jgi:hypothetical protein
VVRVPAGSYLFHAGESGDAMYAVRSGRLEVQRADDGAPIGVLGPGAAVGELALLAENERTASVKAVRDSELIGVDRQRFHQLLSRDAAFAAALTTVLGRRLAATMRTEQQPPVRRNVVSVVALSPGVPTERIAEDLRRVVAGWQTVEMLEPLSSQVDGVPDERAWGAALDRAEAVNDVVVLAASDADEVTWRDFCLRHGDRVLLVVDPATRWMGPVDEHAQGRDLAFHARRPPNAADVRHWVDRLAPQARHWLPQGDALSGGIERATRRIFGRSVGVVSPAVERAVWPTSGSWKRCWRRACPSIVLVGPASGRSPAHCSPTGGRWTRSGRSPGTNWRNGVRSATTRSPARR